ncbi:MAG: hypothetical protein PWR13_967 [Archaeoglobi archaeon]|nr:hypothetical protein [Archaeoglobi archaeon]
MEKNKSEKIREQQIKNLEIKNFKSVKDLKLECRRINVFIGEPNTGKSNILEALGFISYLTYGGNFRAYVRFQNMTNLFFDMDLGNEVSIKFSREVYIPAKGKIESITNSVTMKYERNFNVYLDDSIIGNFDMAGYSSISPREILPCKFYRFKILDAYPREELSFLYPPHGDNLTTILLTNREVRLLANDILKKFNLKLIVKPVEKTLEVQKELDWIVISYPYQLISDTLQRIIFYLAAIETNKNSIIVFEEPEANAFPFYTKFLAERIALDNSNQYFISTHNPYLLLSLLSKALEKDIQVFITYLKDNQTKVKALSTSEKSEILDLDASVFFDIERFLEG